MALKFDKFADGRAFSYAELLRERHGFKGELRATGEVLLDEIALMLRCGFTSFEVTDANTLRALARGPPAEGRPVLPAGAGPARGAGGDEAVAAKGGELTGARGHVMAGLVPAIHAFPKTGTALRVGLRAVVGRTR